MIKKIKRKLVVRKAVQAEKKLQKALKQEARALSKKTNTEYDKSVISWKAPEYIKYKKGWVWYTVFAVVMLASIYGAYVYSLTFAMALTGFAIAYLIFDFRHPKEVKVSLSELGIKVGNNIYQFNRIRAFWILYSPPIVNTLNIRVHNEFIGDIEIQLDGVNPVEVYNFLSTRIPEMEGKEEGFLKGLTRLLKI